MAKNYPDELKLRALGLIKADRDLKELVIELDVTYPVLLKWRRELNESIENGTITDLVDVDKVVVHETAERIKQSLIDLDPTQATVIEGKLDDTVSGVAGYQLLSVRLQTVALTLANKIEELTEDDAFNTPAAIESLVGSLARIQEAFFNKNGTYIQVLNNNNGNSSSNSVSRFKELQKP